MSVSTTLSLSSLATVDQELLEYPALQLADTAPMFVFNLVQPSESLLFSLNKLQIETVN